MAKQRNFTSNLGLYVYGGAAIFLGILGLVSGDFATNWQNVGPNVPLRVPVAYLTAVIELAGGIALLLPRTARAGALTLTIVYSVFTLIWVPKAFVNLGNYDPIGNVFEEFALVAAGLVLCAIFSPAGSSIARRRPFFVLLFGICPISFGIVHIIDMPGLLGGIPGWLPPSKMFWAYATTMGFFGAAIAILTGVMAPIAARLLTAEIVIFELLFWIPHLSGGPINHFNWAGNAISIALAGAAWVVSDSISAAARTKPIPQNPLQSKHPRSDGDGNLHAPGRLCFTRPNYRVSPNSPPIASARIDLIDERAIEEYVVARRATVGPATVNRELATLPHLAFLISTTSFTWEPREIARRLSGETSKAKTSSESKAVSFLGALPSSGADQMFPAPFSS
jgi:uncharacterized membrane protein YphA (DoxX/SURF4 family)